MIELQSTYAELPPVFYQEIAPSIAKRPELLALNAGLAAELGLELENGTPEELAQLFSGARIPEGARPIAMAYAGHQFGHFVPQLGDGRAILLGEVVSPAGQRFDVHLKGAGQTRYSRNGDGRSSLGPVIREYIVSEAMHALGVPTTRALAAVSTGETVHREGPLPGAALARVASSHIRVGTFEFFAARGLVDELKTLADYAIERHYADLAKADNAYLELFRRIARSQLRLVAKWMGVGFIHGVMNTDNTAISGETLDFGPCAFMDRFDFDQVYSSIDHKGRYRYRNQGPIALWNLASLANCLVPLVSTDEKAAIESLTEIMGHLEADFEGELLNVMCAKLGIFEPRSDDGKLIEAWLDHLQAGDLDFTNSFRTLAAELESEHPASPLIARWRARLAEQPQSKTEVASLMNAHNPAYIPRNHQVERAIQDALAGDLGHFQRLNEVLAKPYQEQPEFDSFKAPPLAHEVVEQTFCGT